MESQNNAVRTLDYVNRNKTGGKAYLQGMVALSIVLVSALVAVFVYVPYVAKTKEIAKKRTSLEQEVQTLQKKYDTISGYNRSDLADELKSARYFIPDEIRVAQLATFINVNAKLFNLQVARLGINEDRSEIKQSLGDAEKVKLLGEAKEVASVFLGRVEGPFSFTGTRDDIYKFLDFLVMGGFATNFDQVSLTTGETDTTWSVTFFTSYYYLQPVTKVNAATPLLEIDKSALKPITVNNNNIVPTPIDNASPSPTPTL
ncbi:hypothetical protein CO112_02930 [Candidatus Dojkabacteria bacterium CG_4_9_14_3_um_filter_150_Dojkabacteria_WS6_41_13]|uniref:Uncharacterized protein n=1 Tax=Candidatus Dojkabacteria bacterium CG_4_10_14_0_2_um_filter_Dojkabacteria_WS6_41_15 TaxID=2014249 RepID=A0A2M7W1M1_9BACT|nr:MAG: hypothetical protein COX64_04630 [Candidatus Dojkabacteria bacterium CG_4_10_14_0_2_um_filter_Dojkabacteria_WS6_41_15]PJB22705.1 MAG: hypothetical protein CO112_02930 [Candidatus Dojkabacteria bacterium CG_4_9_14_3_um_filter_150_Dojkabacteria_WS6_41_13]